MPASNKTAIEALVEKADAEEGRPGYHVQARFPNGDVLNAPHLRVGPNWAAFDELGPDELVVDLTGATLSIDWAPGPAYATGERFKDLAAEPVSPKR